MAPNFGGLRLVRRGREWRPVGKLPLAESTGREEKMKRSDHKHCSLHVYTEVPIENAVRKKCKTTIKQISTHIMMLLLVFAGNRENKIYINRYE